MLSLPRGRVTVDCAVPGIRRPMSLRCATANEVDPFVDLLEDAARWMCERGIDQWRPGSMRAQRAGVRRRAEPRRDLGAESIEPDRRRRRAAKRTGPDLGRHARCRCAVCQQARGRARRGRSEHRRSDSGWPRSDCERTRSAWIRLDCVASNESLARYYQQRGYYPRGSVRSGDVDLLRHDKRLRREPGVAVGSLDDVDFARWQPDRVATLLFVVQARAGVADPQTARTWRRQHQWSRRYGRARRDAAAVRVARDRRRGGRARRRTSCR